MTGAAVLGMVRGFGRGVLGVVRFGAGVGVGVRRVLGCRGWLVVAWSVAGGTIIGGGVVGEDD